MRGYSLIECLCSMAITAMLLAAITQLLHRSAHTLNAQTEILAQRVAITKTAQVLSSAINISERSHIPNLISITNGSLPRAPHGGAHPVSSLSGSSRPRTASSIISFIEVEPRYRGRITRTEFTPTSIDIDICGATILPTSEQFRTHLILGTSNTCQLTGTPQRKASGCFTLSGSNINGLIATECPPQALLEYLPVVREFSLYIDTTGEFRLVSHAGLRILENQPIVRGLRSLDITSIRSEYGSLFFNVTLYATSLRKHSFLFASGLTIEDNAWNEVLP
jgi:prepilin-type N-terminal cleavage/methylation domain-containing protein